MPGVVYIVRGDWSKRVGQRLEVGVVGKRSRGLVCGSVFQKRRVQVGVGDTLGETHKLRTRNESRESTRALSEWTGDNILKELGPEETVIVFPLIY